MYIPNSEKQVHIPNTPYEPGDILVTVTNEPINSIIYNNPNRIKVNNNRLQPLSPASLQPDTIPIGLNIGAIEHIYPNDIKNLPTNNDYGGNEYNIDIITNGDNGYIYNGPNKGPMNVAKNMNSNKLNFPNRDSDGNADIIEQQWWSNKIKYPNKNPQGQPNKHYPNIGGLNEHVYTFKSNDASYPSGGLEDMNNPISNRHVTFNIWFNQQMKSFQDIKLPHDIKSIDTIVLRSLVLETLSENSIHVSPDGVITDSKGMVIDAANLELRPMLIGETVNQKILRNSLNKIILPKHLPYLEGILVTLVYPSQVLGIIPLGKTYLPSTTYVVDSKISQPAIVNSSYIYRYPNGNSASYSGTNSGSYPLTVKETYSGGNNGVSSYPYSGNREPKYSYTYSNIYRDPLPASYSYSGGKIEPNWGSNKEPNLGVTEVSYWSSGPYTNVPQGPYMGANWNPTKIIQPLGERRKLSDVKIKHHYEAPKQRKNKKKGKGLLTEKPEITNPKEVTANVSTEHIFEPININASESGRRFSLPSMKGVVKTLLYLLSDLPSRRDNKLESNSTEDLDILNGSENSSDNDDRPDFRIIGGNAATGSGTPLSNKGRSGYNHYI